MTDMLLLASNWPTWVNTTFYIAIRTIIKHQLTVVSLSSNQSHLFIRSTSNTRYTQVSK